jgi:hypothetical protein
MTNIPDITKYKDWDRLEKLGFEKIIFRGFGKRMGIGCALVKNHDEIITVEPYFTYNPFLKQTRTQWKMVTRFEKGELPYKLYWKINSKEVVPKCLEKHCQYDLQIGGAAINIIAS